MVVVGAEKLNWPLSAGPSIAICKSVALEGADAFGDCGGNTRA